MSSTAEPLAATVAACADLFSGRTDAYGLGEGRVVRERATFDVWRRHLNGERAIGIFPLRDDGTVLFAAVDLDRPDLDGAQAIARILPGPAFIERSRSGNYHIFVFFSSPCPAWVARGILKHAITIIGDPRIEIFPKQDTLREGMVGNYINAPYAGDSRPVLDHNDGHDLTLDEFLTQAKQCRNNTARWESRCAHYGIGEAELEHRERGKRHEPHGCAMHIIRNAEDNPLRPGARNIVLFNLAKMLLDCSTFDEDEVRMYVEQVNEAGTDPMTPGALNTLLASAIRGGYTSTGCDLPIMADYIAPDCHIAGRTGEPAEAGGLDY